MKKTLAVSAIVALAGCAGLQPDNEGWVKVRPAYTGPIVVQYSDAPCGVASLNGCWHVGLHFAEVKKGLSDADRDCVIRHETKHAAGYDHGPAPDPQRWSRHGFDTFMGAVIRPVYRMDCGD